MHCRAVDGFRKPSSLQLSGQLRPGVSTGCLGFGGRLMHHHLAGLANSLFFLLQAVCGVYGSLRVRTAQTIRAVLLAIATVAKRAGFRSSSDVSHLLARTGCDLVCRTRDVMPTTSNDRKY